MFYIKNMAKDSFNYEMHCATEYSVSDDVSVSGKFITLVNPYLDSGLDGKQVYVQSIAYVMSDSGTTIDKIYGNEPRQPMDCVGKNV
jgi:hypothetical protein